MYLVIVSSEDNLKRKSGIVYQNSVRICIQSDKLIGCRVF